MSDRLLEQFAEQLAKLFVGGELYITDWTSAPGAKIKARGDYMVTGSRMLAHWENFLQFTIGPAAKRPMHVELQELSPAQAAAFATNIFVDVSTQQPAMEYFRD